VRAPLSALLVLLAGCTLSPDVSQYEAKSAADCPGQKACGYRCVDFDDPAAGCTRDACSPCPAGAANTVAVCGELETCTTACAPGFADCDATPGCERAVSADAANCGACGHACPASVACVDGQCQAVRTVVADTGEAPRGLALTSAGLAWANDPAVTGGQTPKGTLHLADASTGATLATLPGFGHPTFVRSIGGGRPELAVAGTDAADGGPLAWYVDTSAAALEALVRGGGQADGEIVGLAIWDFGLFSITGPPEDVISYDAFDGNASGGASGYGPHTGLGTGGGANLFWVGAGVSDVPGRVYRFLDADDGWGPSVVSGGGVYFDDLPPGVAPEAHRIAARAGATVDDPYTVYFADLRDGSIWIGRTTGPDTAVPWRLVRGDGRPRTAMDVAADALGAVWSDHDAGELWAVTPTGQQHRLAKGVRPWAIHLTATEVLFTDTAARKVLAVPR